MKQVLIKQGGISVDEVPDPSCSFGHLLIQVEYSCVSPGTELVSVTAAQTPLWKRAWKQKENVRRVLDMVWSQGLRSTYAKVQGKLGGGSATGYSVAGRVVEVGDGVDGFNVGDRVACGGAGAANHAGFVNVPMNLCVKVPEGVRTDHAATVTLGAIALQGIRRCQPTLGEYGLVVGLGALGLLSVQILAANGVMALGSDPDPRRRSLALTMGAMACFDPAAETLPDRIALATGGLGADFTVVTASGDSDAIMSEAFRATRRKGRVILVGGVGLNLNRSDIYAKELDFLISCSYGPGRYDPNYEEAGIDYPLSYVRWTENRNMQAYLELIRSGRVTLRDLVGQVFPVEQAAEAYRALQADDRPPMVLMAYAAGAAVTQVTNGAHKDDGQPGYRIALVGAGSFAQGMHLPLLKQMGGPWSLQAVVTKTGLTANTVARQYGAAYGATELSTVLQDPQVDWLLVCSPHEVHSCTVLQGLRAGKHVFVEKPLCLLAEELEEITRFYVENPAGPRFFIGYNRRFSPVAQRLKEALAGRTSPVILNYRMNAGFIPKESPVHGPSGGGRNLGEACHIYDLFLFLVGSPLVGLQVKGIGFGRGRYAHNDNFVATLTFADGSLATLTYTALGSKAWPKEHLEAFWDDTVAELEDYQALTFHGRKLKGIAKGAVNKGHLQEWHGLAKAHGQGRWGIPLDEQLLSAAVALQVEAELNKS